MLIIIYILDFYRYVIIMNSLDVIKEANVKSGVDFAQREPTYCFGGFDAEERKWLAYYILHV